MESINYALIIPARYQSTRLPGKPLIHLCGMPMVIRTYQQCIKVCPKQKVFVATEDKKIKKICEAEGIQVLMTSGNCLTGTDRVAECIEHIDAEIFINIQGDEPLFNPDDLQRLIKSIEKYPGEILNGVSEINNEVQYQSRSIPKVVMREDNRLLYMSRAGIPANKASSFVKSWRQICAYVFPKEALLAFAEYRKKTELEDIEDIEILRFLEMGWDVRMIPMSNQSIAVDLPEDIILVEQVIRKQETL